jgi:hypothetical protein
MQIVSPKTEAGPSPPASPLLAGNAAHPDS